MALTISPERAIAVLENEKKCILSDCDRECGKCELALESEEIIAALDRAIWDIRRREIPYYN